MTSATAESVARLAGGSPDTGHERVAAIDIGSNSIRQIVADVAPDGNIRVVGEMKAAPRLGAGLDNAGHLSDAAMERATEAITRMATLAHRTGGHGFDAAGAELAREGGHARDR